MAGTRKVAEADAFQGIDCVEFGPHLCLARCDTFLGGRVVQTFAHTDFGLFGEQRLALEPTLLAVMLAGGLGAFIHYELPTSGRMSEIPTWGAVSKLERKDLSSTATGTSALQIPVDFGTNAPQIGKLQSQAAARSEEPQVSTAILLNKRAATTESLMSRWNRSAAKQDYVIRLTFPEPAAIDLAVEARPSSPKSGVFVGDALPIIEPGPATSLDQEKNGLDLVNDGIAADGAAVLDPAVVVEIQTVRLAELQAVSVVEPQGFTGLALMPLDGSKFDLALVPKSAPWAAEPRAALATVNRTASTKPAAKPKASNRAGLKLADKQDRIVGEFIFHRTAVQLNDSTAGNVDVRIGGDTSLSIQVSALLSIVKGHMDPGVFAAISASAGASEYVSFGEIRAAGIGVRYDAAADRIVLTAD